MSISYADALRYARNKEVMLPESFYLLDLNARQYATTVSGLASLDQIRSVISLTHKAIESGSTFQEFKKMVEESGIELSPHHLENIFRTNIQSAYAHGIWTQQQSNKSNRPYLQYSSLTDSRVRPSHLELNKIIRHIDDAFWQEFYPPNGFLCFLPDTNIDGASLGGIKRFYSGKTVEVITKSGRNLRVTANHPILTSRGWVAADGIKNGDNLIAYNRPIKGLDVDSWSREIYDNKSIPMAKDLFNAFVSHALTIGEVGSFEFDCNLLASDSEVHINVINGGLVVDINTKSLEFVGKILFKNGASGAISSDSLNSIGSSDCPVVVTHSIFPENSGDVTKGRVGNIRNFTLPDFIGFILSKNSNLQISVAVHTGLPSGGALTSNSTISLFDGFPLGGFGLASSSQDNALFSKLSTDGASGDFGLFMYLIDTHSCQVFSDPVVNIINDSYVGHVYDFQSDCGLLSANGIITHNCRCGVNALTEAQALRLGITPDDALPSVQPDKGWAVSPASYGTQLNSVVQNKIDEALLTDTPLATELSKIKEEALISQKANEDIVKAFEPMNEQTKKNVESIVDLVLSGNKDVEPSAIRMLSELVRDDEQLLTDLLKTSATKNDKRSKSIIDWMNRSFQALLSVAKNLKNKITGNNLKGFDSLRLQVGGVIGIKTPTLFVKAENAGKNVTILDMRGQALDLSKINGLNGSLLAPDLNLEVVSVTDSDIVLRKTDKVATQLFIANNMLYSLD